MGSVRSGTAAALPSCTWPLRARTKAPQDVAHRCPSSPGCLIRLIASACGQLTTRAVVCVLVYAFASVARYVQQCPPLPSAYLPPPLASLAGIRHKHADLIRVWPSGSARLIMPSGQPVPKSARHGPSTVSVLTVVLFLNELANVGCGNLSGRRSYLSIAKHRREMTIVHAHRQLQQCCPSRRRCERVHTTDSSLGYRTRMPRHTRNRAHRSLGSAPVAQTVSACQKKSCARAWPPSDRRSGR